MGPSTVKLVVTAWFIVVALSWPGAIVARELGWIGGIRRGMTMIDFADDPESLGYRDPWEDWRWDHLPLGPEYTLFERQRQQDIDPWRLPMLWTKKDWDNRAAIFARYRPSHGHLSPRG
jgi:hypothetical protein